MNPIEEYLLNQPKSKKEILFFLHDLLTQEYELVPKLKYKIPFYYGNSWIIYLNVVNKKGVEFAFTQGFRLSDEENFLNAKGRKMIKSIEFLTLEEIDLKPLKQAINEAIKLDQTKPKKA